MPNATLSSSEKKKSTADGCEDYFCQALVAINRKVKVRPKTELEGFSFLLFPTCHLLPDTKSFFCIIIITIPRSLLLSLFPQLLQHNQEIDKELGQTRKFTPPLRVHKDEVSPLTIRANLWASATRSCSIITSSSCMGNAGSFLPIRCSMRWNSSTSYLKKDASLNQPNWDAFCYLCPQTLPLIAPDRYFVGGLC